MPIKPQAIDTDEGRFPNGFIGCSNCGHKQDALEGSAKLHQPPYKLDCPNCGGLVVTWKPTREQRRRAKRHGC
jgi:hypothetical protein